MAKGASISGFPEWLPAERVVEQRVIDTLRSVFELNGFVGIETRAIEPGSSLLKKGETSKEIYLLRNESRKGIGFFESSGFYPDFILWVNEGEKQHVIFIDPKGIRNLKGLQDPKIQLYNQLKTEVQPLLGDKDINLDSYIISNTPYNQLTWWGTKEKFYDNHIIFQTDSSYIDVLFNKILA